MDDRVKLEGARDSELKPGISGDGAGEGPLDDRIHHGGGKFVAFKDSPEGEEVWLRYLDDRIRNVLALGLPLKESVHRHALRRGLLTDGIHAKRVGPGLEDDRIDREGSKASAFDPAVDQD